MEFCCGGKPSSSELISSRPNLEEDDFVGVVTTFVAVTVVGDGEDFKSTGSPEYTKHLLVDT